VKVKGTDAPFYRMWDEREPAFDVDGYEGPKPEATRAKEPFVCRPI